MLMIGLLVGILLAAFTVMGWLWLQFHKEFKAAQEKSAVALEDVNLVQSSLIIADQREQIVRLKAKLEEMQQTDGQVSVNSAVQDEERLAHLRAENVAFRQQVDDVSRQLKDAQENIVLLEKGRVDARGEFEGVLASLRAENVQLREQVAQGSCSSSGREQDESFVVSRLRELEMSNAMQVQKNDYLQYELTKSRAQVIGLERLCGHVSSDNAVIG